MGFFSFITKDTNRDIPSIYDCKTCAPVFTVYMHSPDGTIYKEDSYEGYGVFGGKDYYVLIGEINNIQKSHDEDERDYRCRVIREIFNDDKTRNYLYPILTENPYYFGSFDVECEDSPTQGGDCKCDETEDDVFLT